MSKLTKYAEIKRTIKMLELDLETIAPEVLAEVQLAGGKIETDYGKFNVMKRKVWEFPEYVTEAKEEYDLQKARSQELGEARYTEEATLTFKA